MSKIINRESSMLQLLGYKIYNLLDSDIMHNYPTSASSNTHHQWTNWYGPLPQGIESLTTKFLRDILDVTPTEQLPQLAILISQLNVNRGGLGFLNASLKAAPDFVLNMMLCHRRSTKGFLINNDINTITLHETITHLYDPNINTESMCLQRYNTLLSHIAPLCCLPTCPSNECIYLFENNITLHSARGRLKKIFGDIITTQIYNKAVTNNKEHIHLLPSILSPQMSFPLVGMCRSDTQNRLPNWATTIAIKRKLQLHIFNEYEHHQCKCGIKHNPWGDHTFNCTKISKKLAHNLYNLH